MRISRTISIALIVVGFIFVFYLIINKIPSKVVSWGHVSNSSPTSLNVFSKFNSVKNSIKNKFTSNTKLNIVIFGIPGNGYIAGKLADSIIVAHLDESKNLLYLISIPRDLWVSDKNSSFKFNEVLERDKLQYGLNTIKDITGLSINGYIVVDLNIVKSIVNWLGGVDIVLDEPAVDWVSGYTMKAGKQHLNGADAVWLIRNRYNPEGDFFREKNQHKIISALLVKISKLSNNQRIEFVKKYIFNSSLLNNAGINFSKIIPLLFNNKLNNIKIKNIALYPNDNLFKISSIKSNRLISTSTLISIVVPVDGFGNYTDIRNYIQKKLHN